jgi:hypothetical protein
MLAQTLEVAQLSKQCHPARSAGHSPNHQAALMRGYSQITGKPPFNLVRLGGLLLNTKPADPAHQPCWRMQRLLK